MDAGSTTVGVIGLGYVGLPTAIGFLDAGFEVWGVDISERTVATVREGRNPTGDPDVDDLVPAPGTPRWHKKSIPIAKKSALATALAVAAAAGLAAATAAAPVAQNGHGHGRGPGGSKIWYP